MHQVFAAFLIALFFSSPAGAQSNDQTEEKDFPMLATVVASKVKVYSGPAKVHYATDRLAKGTEVQVFRLDPNGWCAIRPPKRSFSIVAADQIEQTEIDLGIVRQNKTPAWVGTLLGSVTEPMWQVQLNKNEEVKILGMIETPDDKGESKQAWFQITPPPGEFRWIRIADLSLTDQQKIKIAAGVISPPARQDQESVRQRNDSIARTTSRQSPDRPRTNVARRKRNDASEMLRSIPKSSIEYRREDVVGRNSSTNPRPESGWRRAQKPTELFVNNQTDSEPLAPSSAPPTNVVSNQIRNSIPTRPIDSSQSNRTNDTNSQIVNIPPSANSSAIIGNQQLQQLELDLTREMQKPAEHWIVTPLKQKASSYRNQTNDVQQQMWLDRMLTKISNCEIISQQASRAATKFTSTNPNTGERTADLRNANGSTVDTSNQFSRTYDAFGTLSELVRDGGVGRSTYVLQDENGNITHHIQSAPGLNLHRYLRKKVGVIGKRGFNQRLNLKHVTAHRVVELETIQR